jgi:HPt (histidine-containing phosphotransfer) domain-containing protein
VSDRLEHRQHGDDVDSARDLWTRLQAVKILLDNLVLGLRQIGAGQDAVPAPAVLALLEAEAEHARNALAAVIGDFSPLAGAGEVTLDGSLQRLMAVAGPTVARDLVDRLLDDLSSVATALRKAAPEGDWAVLRAQSHVLIALAGAAGSRQLQTTAEALNLISIRADTAQLDRVLPACLVLIAAVRDRVAALPLPGDPGQSP